MIELLIGASKKVLPPVTAITSVLCHFDGEQGGRTTTDEKGNTVTFDRATRTILTTGVAAKFGPTGLANSGGVQAGGVIISGSSLLPTTNDDWTIEFWLNAFSAAAGGRYNVFAYDSLKIDRSLGVVYISDTKNSISTSITLPSNVFKHIALVKHEGFLYVYGDGVLTGSFASTTPFAASSAYLFWTSYDSASYTNAAAIDEFRMCKNAVYLSAFTPPTAPFTL